MGRVRTTGGGCDTNMRFTNQEYEVLFRNVQKLSQNGRGVYQLEESDDVGAKNNFEV